MTRRTLYLTVAVDVPASQYDEYVSHYERTARSGGVVPAYAAARVCDVHPTEEVAS